MEISNQFPATSRQPRTSASNPVWMDVLRVLLGLFLFIKGVSFLSNNSDVFYLLSQQNIGEPRKASLFLSVFHILGGLMITIGALTRFALLCQIPILLGAVLVVNSQQGFSFGNQELWISMLVLALLLFFMVMGPGNYSVDNKVFRSQPQNP